MKNIYLKGTLRIIDDRFYIIFRNIIICDKVLLSIALTALSAEDTIKKEYTKKNRITCQKYFKMRYTCTAYEIRK